MSVRGRAVPQVAYAGFIETTSIPPQFLEPMQSGFALDEWIYPPVITEEMAKDIARAHRIIAAGGVLLVASFVGVLSVYSYLFSALHNLVSFARSSY